MTTSPNLKLAVATSSSLAADAAAETASAGGNAVDCAVAAALLTMNTEPGVCAFAGGAYITVWRPGHDPITIDGGVAIPGLGQTSADCGNRGTTVSLEYGGGVETVVGGASVAIPGSPAACNEAVRRYGRLPFADALRPSIRAAAEGFPLPAACHHYLRYSGKTIFGRADDGYKALHGTDGALNEAGSTVLVPGLADSLASVAENGTREFYEGELGRKIVAHVRDGGGRVTQKDFSEYRAIERPALRTRYADWTLALNPPPAIGGAMLAGMLSGLTQGNGASAVSAIVHAQESAMRFRVQHLDGADDVDAGARKLLAEARAGTLGATERSSATVHTSAVDSSGLGCSVTSSAGYGSGEIPAGTGLWLNNCLGELELNLKGLDASPPGARLPSNMTPGIARHGDRVLAFGSPGADRITTALQQFLFNHLANGVSIGAANAAPRLHVELDEESFRVSAEEGIDFADAQLTVRRYPLHSMYFGGVGAAVYDPAGGLGASADPRRVGGIFVSQ